jgi:hypothetical protein
MTFDTTQALVKMLQDAVNANPPSFPPDKDVVTLPIASVVAQKTIDDLLVGDLVYSDYLSVPGLIAGGVGKDQGSCLVGANTAGAQDDARTASGTITVSRASDGTFSIDPAITYTVVDTLDFCPGNCGGYFAQRLTVPLSRWEASGISGDVPFTVRFPAPSLVGSAGSEG